MDIILQGANIRSNFGSFGICTIALLRGEKNILFDTGHFGTRRALMEGLEKRGLKPDDIDIVILSHLHWDHALNIDLFQNSTLMLHSKELDYARKPKSTDLATAWSIIPFLENLETKTVEGDTEIIDGVKLIETTGHSIGHLSALVKTTKGLVVIAGDALPSSRAFIRGKPDFIFWSADEATQSIRRIKGLTTGIIYPGHDRPFQIIGGGFKYVSYGSMGITTIKDIDENYTITISTEEATKPLEI